jgi:acetyl-CoA synthetase
LIHAVERPKASIPTHCTPEQYAAMYRASVETPDAFWLEQAQRLDWVRPPKQGGEWAYDPVGITWFEDGTLNLCHNAIDRHLAAHADRTALIFEPDDPASPGRSLTYGELHREVVRMANAMKALGVAKALLQTWILLLGGLALHFQGIEPLFQLHQTLGKQMEGAGKILGAAADPE